MASAPLILPGSIFGKNGAVAPSNKIIVGAIGIGGRMTRADLPSFLAQPDVQLVAVADCFAERRQTGKEMVDGHYGNKDCAIYRYHEEILERSDIDAVIIATGDRWHAPLSAAAARAGKDVYTEKPFCLTIMEGRRLVNLMNRLGTVWQCGTQRRSVDTYAFIVDVIHRGLIGHLEKMTAFLGPRFSRNLIPIPEEQPLPDENNFDYNRWLGQAPAAPYSETKVRYWRNRWDTSGGLVSDMGPHYCEIMQWAHQSELSAPVEYEGSGEWPDSKDFNEMPHLFDVEARYSDGVKILFTNGEKGIRFQGDQGWIQISDLGVITAEPLSILAERREFASKNYRDLGGHTRNFLEAVKNRSLPISHPEVAQRGHTVAHSVNTCLRLGRKIRWDRDREQYIGDADANRLLDRPMRSPWIV
jgi:predicted dehydrogenase